MAKIPSPVKRWPGTVTLPAYLSWPQIKLWRTASEEAKASTDMVDQEMAWLRAICAIVEEWDLKGLAPHLTPETFPATPPRAGVLLINWLIQSIGAVIAEEDEAPNA